MAAEFNVELKIMELPEVKAIIDGAKAENNDLRGMLRVVADWYDSADENPFTPEMRARIEELTQA